MQPKPAFILALLLTLLVATNIFFLSHIPQEKESAIITRIIDGDTIEINGNENVRLENINTPERGEHGFQQAKDFLSPLLNQTIQIKRTGTDKYSRTLAKIYTPKYLNLEIIKQGYAKTFLADNQDAKTFKQAEQLAIKEEIGLWKKSQHFDCITSTVFQDTLFFNNSCPELNTQNLTIAFEGRKRYNFQTLLINETIINISNANKRDTIYLFDKENSLVHYNLFGY